MDYEKKYKNALEWARRVMQGKVGFVLDEVLDKFPELKESEDEEIRKDLLYWLYSYKDGNEAFVPAEDVDVWIKWLEKQGEILRQRAAVIMANMLDDKIDGIQRELIGFATNAIEAPWLEIIKSADCYAQRIRNIIDEQGEQKSADKIEPKFHEGDWVVYEYGDEVTTLQIKNIVDGTYEFTDGSTLNVDDENTLRLWTIQDAKEGDVLVASDDSIFLFKDTIDCACRHYVVLTTDDVVEFNEGFKHFWETSRAVHPATKEQSDLLFQKIKEAGYEWDAEKKELKKIEQKPDALSEDDGRIMKEIIQFFIDASNSKTRVITSETFVKWAKFLKQKEQKVDWSEEDEENRLNANVAFYDYFDEGYAEKLCSWLKELKYIVG